MKHCNSSKFDEKLMKKFDGNIWWEILQIVYELGTLLRKNLYQKGDVASEKPKIRPFPKKLPQSFQSPSSSQQKLGKRPSKISSV